MTGEALAGRVVLITGSSRGIGAAIARRAAADGAIVAVHFNHSADAADRMVTDLRAAGAVAEAFEADVAVGAEAEGLVGRVVARFGRIDGLVNNAGLTQVSP